MRLPGRTRAPVRTRYGAPTAAVITSQISAMCRDTNVALESLETSFHQDLNGDGVIGVGDGDRGDGSTGLVEVGNNYFLNNSSGSGPSLKYLGRTMWRVSLVCGRRLARNRRPAGMRWPGRSRAPISTECGTPTATATKSHKLDILSGHNVALESLETSFHQDLNGDGVIGVPGSFASAAALNSGSNNPPTIELSSPANQNSSHDLTDSSSVATSLVSDTFKFTGLDQNGIHNVSISANSESQGTPFAGVSHNSNGTDVNGVVAWNYHVNDASIHSLVESATGSFAASLADHHVVIPTTTIGVLPVLHDFHFV